MQYNNQQQLIKDMRLLEKKIQRILSLYLALEKEYSHLQQKYLALLDQQESAALRLEKVIAQLNKTTES